MSIGGTVASVVGGAFVGLVMGLCLVLENSKCAVNASGVLVDTIAWGCIGGGFGSLARPLNSFGA